MDSPVQFTCLYVAMPLLVWSLVMIMIRLIKGPTLLDRVISADLFSTTGMAVMIVFSILFDDAHFMNVVVVVSVIMFLSTVAFAHYYERER